MNIRQRIHSRVMLTNDYIVGLVDGEGSFTVYIRNPKSTIVRKRRVLVEPRFYIKLVARDKDILYRLKEFFGCGNVYFQREVRQNHQQCYRYEITKRKDLREVIIPFFKKHRLQFFSKRKDFEIFCDLLQRIENGEHRSLIGLQNLFSIKQQMH